MDSLVARKTDVRQFLAPENLRDAVSMSVRSLKHGMAHSY